MRVGFLFAVSFFLFLKSLYLFVVQIDMTFKLFAILQKYEFSSKSQRKWTTTSLPPCCLRYCKSTSFQANHNSMPSTRHGWLVVCDTAKVRVFKQITTVGITGLFKSWLFAILQKYEFSSKSQQYISLCSIFLVVCDTAKVRVFKQITTVVWIWCNSIWLFAILQKYEFSSKSQPTSTQSLSFGGCLRYCKSTSFQANHNHISHCQLFSVVVCDTAKVRVFKQITTRQV